MYVWANTPGFRLRVVCGHVPLFDRKRIKYLSGLQKSPGPVRGTFEQLIDVDDGDEE